METEKTNYVANLVQIKDGVSTGTKAKLHVVKTKEGISFDSKLTFNLLGMKTKLKLDIM